MVVTTRGFDLVQLLRAVTAAFRGKYRCAEDPAFWIEMLEAQLAEARLHLKNGQEEKALAEIADCFAVAFSALHFCGRDPEAFVTHRVMERILPRVDEIVKKYDGLGEDRAQ